MIVYDELIPALATAIRMACSTLTAAQRRTIRARVEPSISLPRKPCWERKAAAHAQLYRSLAEATADDAAVASVLRMGAVLVRDLALTAGPGMDGMITSAHRRLLAHLDASDPEGAEHEAESYLRCLHYMSHLANRYRPARSPAEFAPTR
jgi:DNA-binding FadR family transcriptional regulator